MPSSYSTSAQAAEAQKDMDQFLNEQNYRKNSLAGDPAGDSGGVSGGVVATVVVLMVVMAAAFGGGYYYYYHYRGRHRAGGGTESAWAVESGTDYIPMDYEAPGVPLADSEPSGVL
eukprot:5988286-Pyramimonas_sp.AAC.1